MPIRIAARAAFTHFMCNTEEETLMSIRELLSFLPSNNMEDAPFTPCSDDIPSPGRGASDRHS